MLVVRAGALGDTLMVTPLIRALYEEQAGTEIDFICSSLAAGLLASNPYLASTITLRHRNVPYFFSVEKRKLVKRLKGREYSFAVLLESAPHYRDLLERAGIRDIRSFAGTPFQPNLHSIVNNLRAGGYATNDPNSLRMDLPVSSADIESAQQLLEGLPRPIVGLHPGYGPQGKKKGQVNRLRGWSCENFAQVAAGLIQQGCSIVLVGSKEDLEICRNISQKATQQAPGGNVRILAGKTSVAVLTGVIKSLDLLVSVDSGPAHIAAAVGVPLVVLWGPGILDQTKPISTTAAVSIVRVPVPCAPCYGTQLMKECTRNICMEYIAPAEVIQRASGLLGFIPDDQGGYSQNSFPVLQ